MHDLSPPPAGSASLPDDVLGGVTTDYFDAANPDLLGRFLPLHDWVTRRAVAGVMPYCKANHGRVGPRGTGSMVDGIARFAVQFAVQDYLSLSSHPAVCEAVHAAVVSHGVHSAGSAALMGLSDLLRRLESRIAGFLGLADVTVFPTGWAAGYGAIRTLARPGDHVLIDVLAHACLHEGAAAATPNVHRFPHLSFDGVERRLTRIRSAAPDAGILVVTEGLFSMESDSPADLDALQALCRHHRATLLVDVAHDLGAMGPGGRGVIGLQGATGRLDVVMGSFSKTFASNGGFVASNHPALKYALRFGCGPQTFSNALSPLQAAGVLAAFDIVDSAAGSALRQRLATNVQTLRKGLTGLGYEVMGNASAIVPVRLGDMAQSRLMTAAMIDQGVFVNLVEFPAVARNASRWRLQVMAGHEQSDIDTLLAAASGLKPRFRAGSRSAQPAEQPLAQDL